MRYTLVNIKTLEETYSVLRGLEDRIGEVEERPGSRTRTFNDTENKASHEILKARMAVLEAITFLKAQAFDEANL